MPSTECRCCSAMVFGGFLASDIWELDAVSVARSAGHLGAEGEGHTPAHVIGHFLNDHLRIHCTPVPLVLVSCTEPADAVKDDRLDLDPCRAVLVPNTLDPQIKVDVHFVIIYESRLGDVAKWIVESIARFGIPSFGEGLGPCRDQEIDRNGVLKQVAHLLF